MRRLLTSAGLRMTIMAATIFIACMLVIGALIYFIVRDDMEDQLRAQVAAETSQLLGDYADDGLSELRHDISERLERNPGTRLQYTLASPDGRSLFDRLPLPETAGWSRLREEGGYELLLQTTQLEDGYRLGVAADTRRVRETADALRHTLLITLLPVILLGGLAGAFISQRFLHRVERLKRTADQIGDGALSARMPLSGSGDDFDGLIITINRMLDRIEELVHDVRHVSTNIAHDLRTPLGRLRQRLEALGNNVTDAETGKGIDDAIGLLDEILVTFSALLRIAELESHSTPIDEDTVDLPDVMRTVADAYEPAIMERGQHIDLSTIAPCDVTGDRQLLAQLIANLVENASRHNDAGTRIILSCGHRDRNPWLAVADNGRGIAREAHGDVVKPFHRLDESRSSPGSGLGLSLVASIAARHGAALTLSDNGPGLRAVVQFGDVPPIETGEA